MITQAQMKLYTTIQKYSLPTLLNASVFIFLIYKNKIIKNLFKTLTGNSTNSTDAMQNIHLCYNI